MIKILKPLPKKIVVALSGGVDSVAITDFLSRKHNITAAFFHHNTENSENAHEFVLNYCNINDIPLIVSGLSGTKPSRLSAEEWWREERYKFLDNIDTKYGPIITAHNLDDCIETFLWSMLHGTPKVIPYRRNNVIRPFLTTQKKELFNWCYRQGITWCEDMSNTDTKYTRNYVRHQLMPHALHVNPGLHKVVKRIIESKLLKEKLKQTDDIIHEVVHSLSHEDETVSDDKLQYDIE